MKVVQLLPEGLCVKKEVDAALDTVSETMTPMHYHLREIIICTCRQVSVTPAQAPRCMHSPGVSGCWRFCGTLISSWLLLHLLEIKVIVPASTPGLILECLVGRMQGDVQGDSQLLQLWGWSRMWPIRTKHRVLNPCGARC